MPPARLPIEEILSRLEVGPARIASITAGLTKPQLHSPTEGQWSANDILAHVRACHDVWSAVVTAIRSEGQSPRNVAHPRQYVKGTGYLGLDFVTSLRAFSDARIELMATLQALAPEAWQLAGPVRGWTLVCGRSLHDQANRLAHHEGVHLDQIEATVLALRA